ncbi:hypothetical protein [Paenibacillus prosopidis]|uniref:C2H2-type domain-containing protein n=1 Tax=Paenibacillus prosopidis TaxID=630520 RepID=A0A368VT51_9BACL|nr:hypothetical protein [Paenibacillus prosopidis]RCW44221.1 hypothetical protein DFP97_11285 [Paenibacillus prosopidis]
MRTFKAENGNTLTAIDDIQASAMIRGGMTEIAGEEFSCKHCDFMTDSKGQLMTHYRSKHPKG